MEKTKKYRNFKMDSLNFNVEDIISKANKIKQEFNVVAKVQVIEIIEKITKYGDPYYRLVLRDKTGRVRANRFINISKEIENLRRIYEIGNIIKIKGRYNPKFGSIIINEERFLEQDEYNLEDFSIHFNIDKNKLVKCLYKTISNIKNPILKKLLTRIFEDNNVKSKYIECPSSIDQHHSYKYGNLQHTISMIRILNELEKFYNRNANLDVDLIYTGILLHDIGKIKEFSLNNNLPIRLNAMGLIGHIHLGANIVLEYIKDIDDFPEDLKNRILHLILSHHGKKDWGSPVEPTLPEAEVLHYLDMIDSRYKLGF